MEVEESNLVELNAKAYLEVQRSLQKVDEECAGLDAAVELLRVQQEEAQQELASLKKNLAEEEDTRAVLSQSVPSYVLKEDVPQYIAKRAELLATIFALHNAIVDAEKAAREQQFALFGGEEGTMRTLEAAREQQQAQSDALSKSRERLTSQIEREISHIEHATREKEKLEPKISMASEKQLTAQRVLAARRQELSRAREAARDSLDLLNSHRAQVSKARTRIVSEQAHCAEQEALLGTLRAENTKLRTMLKGSSLAAPSQCAGANETSVEEARTSGAACNTQGRGRSEKKIARSVDPTPISTDSLMDHFREVNGSLLQDVARSVQELEVTFAEARHTPTLGKERGDPKKNRRKA